MSKRLFLAIPLKAGLLLSKQKAFLESNLKEEKVNWVKPENMHLTLFFIGKTASIRIPEIIEAIKSTTENASAFSLILERIGIFGSDYHARVIWVGVRENPALLYLQKLLVLAFEKIDFLSDRQNFVPHSTLGRIKQIKHKDHFKRVLERTEKGFIQETVVNTLVLYESILTKEGPIYIEIERFKLP
jgi:2'-5' RNA ligase